jgi:branched-chain amino acid transport system permease protein
MVAKKGKMHVLLVGGLLVLGLLPAVFYDRPGILNILSQALIWGVVVSAWDLSIGFARVWTFGHIAIFAIGGYTVALTAVHLGTPPGVGILLGGAVGALVGILVGLLCLKLAGLYIAVVTLGLHLVLPFLIVWARDFTNAELGIFDFPPLQLGPYIFSNRTPLFSYYIILALSALLLYMIYRIINSTIGLAFMALRDSESFAKSLGVNKYKYMLIVFVISSLIAGLMGAVFTSFYHGISPRVLDMPPFLLALLMIMIGGLGKFPGPVIGAFIILFASEFLRPLMWWRFVALTAIALPLMIFMPQGLIEIPERVRFFIRQTMGKRHKKEVPER